ncbi:MAG TPA: hypothetical protein VN841_25360 [Bryobacteraceae bacterium]|nr:hypothetical protein [Bryobacteraceae bacterium]
MQVKGLYVWAAASCLAAAQVPAPVPLEQEPRHHLLFANEALRVISPQIPPGDTTLEHLHTHDEVTICIQGSSTRGKPHGGEWGNPGMVCAPGRAGVTEYTGNPRSHTVQNVGPGLYHLLLVENLRDSGWTSHPAVEIAGAKMVRENRSFRIYDAELSSSSLPVHSHDVPTVVVLVSGEATVGAKHLDHPGQWVLIPAGENHTVAAQADTHIIEIEVR